MPRKQGRKSSPQADLLLKLHLESNPVALGLVRATVERAAEVLQFQEADARAIVRSVDEALANVLRHAYLGRDGRPIEVTCRRLWKDKAKNLPSGLEIVMEDAGVPLNRKSLQGRPLDEIRPGGLGLHFMKQSMNVVEFRRNHGKNLLRMVKYLPPPQAEAEPERE